MMDPIEDDFVNDEPLAAAEQNGPPRKRRRRAPSVLEPPPRRREQIRRRGSLTRERTELFLRENPVPMVIGALAAGLAIGLAIRYASRSDKKEVEVKTALGRINWSVLSLPFLWPLFRGMKDKFEDSADSIRESVGRVKNIDLGQYTKPIRKRWKSWAN
jgi:hypothetical protein